MKLTKPTVYTVKSVYSFGNISASRVASGRFKDEDWRHFCFCCDRKFSELEGSMSLIMFFEGPNRLVCSDCATLIKKGLNYETVSEDEVRKSPVRD